MCVPVLKVFITFRCCYAKIFRFSFASNRCAVNTLCGYGKKLRLPTSKSTTQRMCVITGNVQLQLPLEHTKTWCLYPNDFSYVARREHVCARDKLDLGEHGAVAGK